ncbi:MAG: tripartite tricarboxylate transporter substrate binding protein [Burkholderiaceae bacterium]|nr:tripartite tricarboxylate transporter substrate binding protein [Burkholderiaceae bacterium]MDO9089065.1 tripartite tricarboxylate transporter substrate binding protein [Burkholderiaceae bacterium]
MPKISRRQSLQLLGSGLLASTLGANAQDYPAKPVTLVVPFAAGSVTDASARLFAKEFTRQLGQSFIVENRPGLVGMRLVKAAPADGLTLLWHSGAATVAQTMLSKPDFDIRRDFSPIGCAFQLTLGLHVRSDLNISTYKQFIEYAKKNPGKLNYSTAGIGSVPHLAVEMLRSKAGIEVVHIPYKGGSSVPASILSGEADFLAWDPAVRSLFKDKARTLALFSKVRSPAYPEIPTMVEEGGPLIEAAVWYALFAPANTPTTIVTKMNLAMKQALESPDIVNFMKTNGYVSTWAPAEEFRKQIANEVTQWTEAVRVAKVPLQ